MSTNCCQQIDVQRHEWVTKGCGQNLTTPLCYKVMHMRNILHLHTLQLTATSLHDVSCDHARKYWCWCTPGWV